MTTHTQSGELLPVVLAGGSGTRLWPLSRESYPKQFLRLTGEMSLLQQTLTRTGGLRCLAPFVVCNEEHRLIVADQCRECGVEPSAVVLEPAARNTAPAAALAAFTAIAGGADPVMIVLPADHHIADETAFASAVSRGVPFAESGSVVVFGILPSSPATDYGYIRAGTAATDDGSVRKVAAFAEKPPRETAEQYLAEGGWTWNSGMFLVRASVYLDELERHRPDIHHACNAAVETEQPDEGFHRAGDAFHGCPAESIDRAVMENTHRGVVVSTDMGWSDVGNWPALAELLPWEEVRLRGWGRAETSRNRDGFRLTRLTLAQGKSLSLNEHGHQSTHWVVVRGLAEVVLGTERLLLGANESTHLPKGVRNRLTNAGHDALVVIEVETGDRPLEDRFADVEAP
ncbi:MAG: sugar phosphate nucleotidyltransferase [Gammaproteobacteria bacterium]|nr:sugar phosphate nucleotidyltransferase [Gammaproteobacteria bacterium]